MGTKELSFPQRTSNGSWWPYAATDHESWGSEGAGTFLENGTRYVYFITTSTEYYRQYVVGEFPEDYEAYDANASDETIGKVKGAVLVHNRQVVHVHDEDINASFFYGDRFCKPCIVCGKELITVNNTDDEIINQPSGGTNFEALGHYGSGAFDPMSDERLSINICDTCLYEKGRMGLVTQIIPRKKVIDESIRKDWGRV